MAIDTTLDPTVRRSRRALLAGAIGGVAALAAEALGRPLAVHAAEGDVVHVGDDLTGTGTTRITTIGSVGLTGRSSQVGGTGVFGDALEKGVVGHATAFTSSGANGVYGLITGVEGAGVSGEATASTGDTVGVLGHSHSNSGTGVYGMADSTSGITVGVRGEAASAAGRGVYGLAPAPDGGTGVWGEAFTPAGVGVVARAATGGVALKSDGKVRFSRSGRASMAKDTSSKKINLAGVTSQSMVFAVLGSDRSGRYVRAAVSGTGFFTIYLNTSLGTAAWVNWFVLD